MESEISVLLRDGTHGGGGVIHLALKTEQVSIAIARTPIQISPPKSTQPDDTLMDLGINKTSITISGIIDNVPTDKSQTTSYDTGTATQSGTTVTGSGTTWTASHIGGTFTFDSGGGGGTITARASNTSITVSNSATVSSGDYIIQGGDFYNMEIVSIGSQNYYIPYKNYLEKKLATWVTDDSKVVQLEIGDATTPDTSSTTVSTGGAIYEVAVQRVQFTLSPGREDRWVYSIQFLAKLRTGIAF